MTVVLPCRIGDEAWAIRNLGKNLFIVHGTVREMMFNDDMELIIRVKGACAGKWGKTVFGNYDDALRALKGGDPDGK